MVRSALSIWRGAGVALVGALAASLACWVVLAVFAQRFERGATLSGLNPDGGGPGFLLLVVTGSIALVTRTRWTRRLGLPAALAEAVVGASLVGSGLMGLLIVAPPGEIAEEPIVSGVVGAFIVPRISAHVLEAAWAPRAANAPLCAGDPSS